MEETSKCCGFKACCSKLEKWFSCFQSPFLLLIRLYWGWSFFRTGTGKFGDIDKVIGFFTDLSIPQPVFSAYLVASVETLCGLLLLLGLFSRLAAIPLTATMIVAFATAHKEALFNIFSDAEVFFEEPPFLFLYACLIVLFFGPGKFSLDSLFCKKSKNTGGGSCCG